MSALIKLRLRALLALIPIRGTVNALPFKAFVSQRPMPHRPPENCGVWVMNQKNLCISPH